MAITTVLTPPSRTQHPAAFSATMDSFLSSIPAWSTEANALAAELTGIKNSVESSASSAAGSASIAADKATLAATKATESAVGATASQNYASSAQSFAANASRSATSAQEYAADAAGSVVAMDKKFLGAKSSAPTSDNQGAALQTGAIYYDTTSGKIRCWNGGTWVDGISAIAGVASVNGQTGTVSGIQPTLVSGTTLKTINGESLLGGGNIAAGAKSLLANINASAASMVEFTSVFDSELFDDYALDASFSFGTVEYITLFMQLKIGGSWVNARYNGYVHVFKNTATSTSFIDNVSATHGNSTIYSSHPISIVSNIVGDENYKTIRSVMSHSGGNQQAVTTLASFFVQAAGTIDGLRIYLSASTMHGTFRLYGIIKS